MLRKSLLTTLLITSLGSASEAFAHAGGHGSENLRTWHNVLENKTVKANFLTFDENKVVLQAANLDIIRIPLENLSAEDQTFANNKIQLIHRINEPVEAPIKKAPSEFAYAFLFVTLLAGAGGVMYRLKTPRRTRIILTTLGLPLTYAACMPVNSTPTLSSVPANNVNFLEKAFAPFKNVSTKSDDTYFYVASNGIPEHNMMVGITSWQQQVPLEQPYTGDNAWSILLKPVLAATPVSTENNFFRGAIGLAVNGVPIFNALNNRGDDAFLVGELDQWGGHCGRADDYHYHTAPLHLESSLGSEAPIAFALDGFAVYGSHEPDGSKMASLDENNGHFDAQGSYHYHGTPDYPYMIAKMRGEVTKSNSDEITPQPRTTPIREFLQPLNGAVITDFKSTGENAYSLEYTVNNAKSYVNYHQNESGSYTFEFVSPDGTTRTEEYKRG